MGGICGLYTERWSCTISCKMVKKNYNKLVESVKKFTDTVKIKDADLKDNLLYLGFAVFRTA